MEDRLERPIERLNHQINVLGEKIKGTQSIIPSDGGSTFKNKEGPILTPQEKSRERQKAIEFGKALGIGNYSPKGKLEDLTPAVIKPAVTAAAVTKPQGVGTSVLGMIGKVISTILNILNFATAYKIIKPYIEKYIGKNAFTDVLFGVFDPIVGFIDDLKKKFIDWFKSTFPKTYQFIVNMVDGVKAGLSWVWEKIKGVFDWIKNFFKAEDKMKFLTDAWEGFKKSIMDMFTPKEGKESLWDWIKGQLDGIMNDLSVWLDKKLEEWNLKDKIEDFRKMIGELPETWTNFKKMVDGFTNETWPGIKKMVEGFTKDTWPKIKKDIEDFSKKTWPGIKEMIEGFTKDTWPKWKKDIGDIIDSVKISFKEIKDMVTDPVGYAAKKAKEKVKKEIKERLPTAIMMAAPVNLAQVKLMSKVAAEGAAKGWESTKSFFGFGKSKTANDEGGGIGRGRRAPRRSYTSKTANDFLVSKRGDFVNFSNQDNVIGFKDGGSIDRVLGRRNDELITDTKQILIESRKQVNLLQKIVENTYNANLLLQKLNNRPSQQSTTNNTRNLIKFNRSEFDIEASPTFNFGNNLATI